MLSESWANEARPYSGLAALWTMVAFCPHSFSRGRLGCILSSDPLHRWVLGMEKLRVGGVGEGCFVMRDLPPSTSLPGQWSRKGAGFELSRGVEPDFIPDPSLENDVGCRGE